MTQALGQHLKFYGTDTDQSIIFVARSDVETKVGIIGGIKFTTIGDVT